MGGCVLTTIKTGKNGKTKEISIDEDTGKRIRTKKQWLKKGRMLKEDAKGMITWDPWAKQQTTYYLKSETISADKQVLKDAWRKEEAQEAALRKAAEAKIRQECEDEWREHVVLAVCEALKLCNQQLIWVKPSEKDKKEHLFIAPINLDESKPVEVADKSEFTDSGWNVWGGNKPWRRFDLAFDWRKIYDSYDYDFPKWVTRAVQVE